MVRLEELGDDPQDAFLIWLAGHLEIETASLQFKEIGQQRSVVDVGAVCGVVVTARADVNADALPFAAGEAIENLIVECDEASQETARGIELEGQPGFCEVDLDGVGAGVECAANVGCGFVDEVCEKFFARSSPVCPMTDRAG